MAKRIEIVDVLVNREWWTTTIGKLLMPYSPRGTSDLHRVRGPLLEQDIHGIWIGDAPSNLVHAKEKDKSKPVLAKIFIPWNRIVALAIIDEPGRFKPGFSIGEVASNDL